MRRLSGWTGALVWVGAVMAPFGSGCATSGGGDPIAEVHLFGVPVALNLDGVPGPDGIGVRIYASAPGVARGVEIQRGALEVLMFEGAVGELESRTRQPHKLWSFAGPALKAFEAETALGVGYQLALRWDKNPPRTRFVTVVARYRGAGGAELWSAPNTVSVAAK